MFYSLTHFFSVLSSVLNTSSLRPSGSHGNGTFNFTTNILLLLYFYVVNYLFSKALHHKGERQNSSLSFVINVWKLVAQNSNLTAICSLI